MKPREVTSNQVLSLERTQQQWPGLVVAVISSSPTLLTMTLLSNKQRWHSLIFKGTGSLLRFEKVRFNAGAATDEILLVNGTLVVSTARTR